MKRDGREEKKRKQLDKTEKVILKGKKGTQNDDSRCGTKAKRTRHRTAWKSKASIKKDLKNLGDTAERPASCGGKKDRFREVCGGRRQRRPRL